MKFSLICVFGLATVVAFCAASTSLALDTEIQVQGQSGKFKVYKKSLGQSDPERVDVSISALHELDASGNKVGTSGAQSKKHGTNSFANQDFTIKNAVAATVSGLNASKIAFDCNFGSPTIGNIKIDTFIFTEGGTVKAGNESWTIAKNDVKWNIELSSWNWCGCNGEVGSMIDVEVEIKGKNPEGKKGANSTYDLGGKYLTLSNEVQIDGVWEQMPAGYPKVATVGGKQIFTFRFPKFNTKAVYDPLITSSPPSGGSGTDSGGSGNGGSGIVQLSTLAVFFSALLLAQTLTISF